jgi:hypothetical protein
MRRVPTATGRIPGVVSVSALLPPVYLVTTMDREFFGVIAVTAGVPRRTSRGPPATAGKG